MVQRECKLAEKKYLTAILVEGSNAIAIFLDVEILHILSLNTAQFWVFFRNLTYLKKFLKIFCLSIFVYARYTKSKQTQDVRGERENGRIQQTKER